MATFITTIKFTPQGIKAIKETTQRAASLKSAAKKMGVSVKHIFWTLGDHDGTLIFEAPDDETAAALMMHLGAAGNVHTATERAFTAAEMDTVLAKVHGG
ncbi:GYD domain protein [Novipirellula galeiformis]|uniref:GYD domain protein n=1 Tax=Novipirellula galeiformis TaxID=2528004 RepID=A0A5C6BZH3_9BACT|nr:GYD domain-containing protein [Novipirellula galeiformis]TWU17335.1 GYD domain protein [Novipirellula galeiformis]